MNLYNRSYSGNAIAQYGIIILLVAVAVIPAFFLLGSTITKELAKMGIGLAEGQSTTNGSNTDNTGGTSASDPVVIEAGSLGGTPSNPIMNCTGNFCSIDYGNYVLNGIPEDFNNYIESSGASGGVDLLAGMLDQILANSTFEDPQTQSMLENLANSGHNIAEVMGRLETTAENGFTCNDGTSNCVDEDLDLILSSKKDSTATTIGSFINLQEQLAYNQDYKNNPDYESIKKIVGLMVGEITQINEDFTFVYDHRDSIEDPQARLDEYNAANRVDLDSAIICATGNGEDNGVQCN